MTRKPKLYLLYYYVQYESWKPLRAYDDETKATAVCDRLNRRESEWGDDGFGILEISSRLYI